jgi:lipoprotein NlpD
MKEVNRMMFREVSRFWFAALTLLVLAGCTSAPRAPAPVETRGASTRMSVPAAAPAPAPSVEVVKVMPGAENAGKPGYLTVQRGDTLTRIGLNNGQSWRDLARWNNLTNPDAIEEGQVLRVVPPNATVEASGVVVQPIGGGAEVAAAVKPAAAPTPTTSANDEGLGFAWPASGNVIGGFDDAKNKGLDIAGKAGDPVLAAADGQVVYAGAGLRGYGNLIILKHNNTFLTAYAHNQALLVKEDQKVRKGQKIAEMGKTDADRVKLHFEIRRQGKPVDPAKYLPAR